MFGRKRRGGRRRKAKRVGWWASVDADRRRQFARSGGWTVVIVATLAVTVSAVRRLDAHVEQRLLLRGGEATLSFVDLPAALDELARDDLTESVIGIMARAWTDDALCREMADRLASIGWVAGIDFVRRTGSGAFEVGARYRLPAAMIQQDSEFMLLDSDGVRLPGTYLFDPTWKLIQGVEARAPGAGRPWPGDDGAGRAGCRVRAGNRAVPRAAYRRAGGELRRPGQSPRQPHQPGHGPGRRAHPLGVGARVRTRREQRLPEVGHPAGELPADGGRVDAQHPVIDRFDVPRSLHGARIGPSSTGV